MLGPSRLSLTAFLPNETKSGDVDDPSASFLIGSAELGSDAFLVPHRSVDDVHATIARYPGKEAFAMTAHPTEHGTSVGGILLSPRHTRFIPAECVFRFGDIRVACRQTGPSPVERYLPKGPSKDWPALIQQEIHNRRRERLPWILLRVQDASSDPSLALAELKPRDTPYCIDAPSGSETIVLSDDTAGETAAFKVSLLATHDAVRVINSGENPIQLGMRLLEPGDDAIWDRLDMLQVGAAVFALFDTVAYVMNAHVSPDARRDRDSGDFGPESLTDALLSTRPWSPGIVTRPTNCEMLVWVSNTRDKDRSFLQVTSALPLHIGRDFLKSACALDDRSVSRRHASIGFRNGELFVLDVNSTNGIRVNGKRIAANTWTSLGTADTEREIAIGTWRIAIVRADPASIEGLIKLSLFSFKELPSQYMTALKNAEGIRKLFGILRAHDLDVEKTIPLVEEALGYRRASREEEIEAGKTRLENMERTHRESFDDCQDLERIEKILSLRLNIEPSDEMRQRLQVPHPFERWIGRALAVESADKFFEDGSDT